jgi:hypothetical protein
VVKHVQGPGFNSPELPKKRRRRKKRERRKQTNKKLQAEP